MKLQLNKKQMKNTNQLKNPTQERSEKQPENIDSAHLKLTQLVQSYEEKYRELERFEENFCDVLQAYSSLKEDLSIYETNIKDQSRLLKKGTQGELFIIEATRKFSRWYDAELLLQVMPDAERRFPKLFLKTLDSGVLQSLVNEQHISNDIISRVQKVQEQTTAITIRRKT